MSRKRPALSVLEARKQLLLAEAEVHRELLVRDGRAIRQKVQTLADSARSYATMASKVLAGCAAVAPLLLRRPRREGATPPPGILYRARRWLRWGTTAWVVFKNLRRV